jgi:hypothetical protein
MAIRPRRFQHTFGRSTQTKALDHILNNKEDGVNIKELSKAIRQSYQYTVLITKDLEDKGLIDKKPQGVESILRPNAKNPVVKWVEKNHT